MAAVKSEAGTDDSDGTTGEDVYSCDDDFIFDLGRVVFLGSF